MALTTQLLDLFSRGNIDCTLPGITGQRLPGPDIDAAREVCEPGWQQMTRSEIV